MKNIIPGAWRETSITLMNDNTTRFNYSLLLNDDQLYDY